MGPNINSTGSVSDAAVTVLVVEDDAAICDVVCSLLHQQGWRTLPAFSGSEARLLIESGAAFDLAICDLMLPGLRGEDVVGLIRERGSAPILVISARSSAADRVSLLHAGADDFLVKPFDLDELAARVQALLRRAGIGGRDAGGSSAAPGAGAPLVWRRWTIDDASRTFAVDGTPLHLTRTEFEILRTLMRHPRKVFTKRELFEAAWCEPGLLDEKTVATHISNIRAKLRESGTDDCLQTVWGIGFKLAEP